MQVEEVLYLDWCDGMAINRCNPLAVWGLLTENKQTALPEKHNKYKQRHASNDCGFAVWYGIEESLKRLRGEGRFTLYPDPKDWRRKLNIFYQRLSKEWESWHLEEVNMKASKVLITLPGGDKEDANKQKEKIAQQKKDGTFIASRETFYSCASCRWSWSGAGCCYCNPNKREGLLKD